MIEKLIKKTKEYLKDNNINLIRDLDVFLRATTSINLNLYLFLKDEVLLEEVVFIKNLYSVWNAYVDDEMDNMKTKTALDSSLLFLVSLNNNNDPSVTILNTILDTLEDRNKELVILDLLEVINGFNYEYYINLNNKVANSIEYEKYSTVTAGAMVYLDIDAIYSDSDIDNSLYRNLRVSYDYYAKSIKYASDISGIERELKEENSLNIVVITAIEKGIITYEEFNNSKLNSEQILTKLRPILDSITKKSLDFMNEAEKYLSQIETIDRMRVSLTYKKVIETYLTQKDNFF
ncbi:MAG: hypothetical protein ACMG57_05840 [Candidatus Dojkabacteria bacterium]